MGLNWSEFSFMATEMERMQLYGVNQFRFRLRELRKAFDLLADGVHGVTFMNRRTDRC